MQKSARELLSKTVIKIIRFFYTWRVYHYLREKFVKLNSLWLAPEFGAFGYGNQIEKLRSLIGAKNISIGNNCYIGINAQLTAFDKFHGLNFTPKIVIGDNVSLGDSIHITSINSITIGDGVLTGRRVTITDHSHGRIELSEMNVPPNDRTLFSKGPVHIGNNVWIGDKASILAGVTIGEGCIVGANSVVTKSIPSFCVVAGVPARIIKRIK